MSFLSSWMTWLKPPLRTYSYQHWKALTPHRSQRRLQHDSSLPSQSILYVAFLIQQQPNFRRIPCNRKSLSAH